MRCFSCHVPLIPWAFMTVNIRENRLLKTKTTRCQSPQNAWEKLFLRIHLNTRTTNERPVNQNDGQACTSPQLSRRETIGYRFATIAHTHAVSAIPSYLQTFGLKLLYYLGKVTKNSVQPTCSNCAAAISICSLPDRHLNTTNTCLTLIASASTARTSPVND